MGKVQKIQYGCVTDSYYVPLTALHSTYSPTFRINITYLFGYIDNLLLHFHEYILHIPIRLLSIDTGLKRTGLNNIIKKKHLQTHLYVFIDDS